MGKNRMQSNKRKRIIRNLYKQHEGKCTKCRREVLIASDAIASGKWIWHTLNWSLRFYRTSQVLLMATIEHIVPVARGGTHDESNLTLLCIRCNVTKGCRLTGEGSGE